MASLLPPVGGAGAAIGEVGASPESIGARRSVEWGDRGPFTVRFTAKLRRTLCTAMWRSRLASCGPGVSIDPPAWIVGAGSICLGSGVRVWRFARLEAIGPCDGKARIIIGDGSVIQPFVHIGAAESVQIGEGCLFASQVYISDHDHDWSDPMRPVVSNRSIVVAPVKIGAFVWLGERVVVLKGVSIGERSIIGAGSVVTRDVPAFCIAAGAPARVIRKWNAATGRWDRYTP